MSQKRESEDSLATESRKQKVSKKTVAEEPEPEFMFDVSNGLRRVVPYWHTYKINAKGRWFKRSLIEVFSEEFKDQTREYYFRAIQTGKVSVNNEKKLPDYLIRSGDVIRHSMHRHEPPVTSDPIKIVFQDNETLVVDKPGSIPVHPTGRYQHNTVTGILKSKEYGFTNVFSVNRLDRLTSGILLLALTKERAAQLSTQLADRSVSKTYLCRVRGKFPENTVICTEPILVTSNKLGVNIVSQELGLPCETHFIFQSYNPDSSTSIIQAHPKTGRMHQIRVHLQFLGYPITNDPIYANPEFWGEALGKGGEGVDMQVVSEKIKAAKVQGISEDGEDEVGGIAVNEGRQGVIPSSIEGESLDAQEFPCPRCAIRLPDPTMDQRRIYLHAWKYSGDGWAYETDIPGWATLEKK
ncbi:UNVERIFIED_CONTAM: hypothetical protein HDU68_010470 [Siphonaria sp. JEL0065]|nr:hypothetical protein HDU68_010470 [Siphonaria sp. JEL0065]